MNPHDPDPLSAVPTDDEPWDVPPPDRGKKHRFRYTDELQWTRRGITAAMVRIYRAAILRARRNR